MSRKSERELTFKLLYMSSFYDKNELSEELLLYFDAPFPFQESGDAEGEEMAQVDLTTLKEALKDSERQKVTARYVAVIEKLDEIDEKIGKTSKGWTIDRIGKVELAILRLAVYEIDYDDDVPASVAINEAVELAKKFGQKDSYSFVNGVLAKFA